MMKFAFVFMIALFVLTSEAMAQKPVDEIDLEVISLLNLNEEQAVAYSAVMQRQRAVYRTLMLPRWEQKMAFYEQTFDKLKPLLSTEQHIHFVAYMDSFIEAIPVDDLLAME